MKFLFQSWCKDHLEQRLERVHTHMFQWMTFVGKNMFKFSLDKMFNGTRVPPKRNITTEDQSQKLLGYVGTLTF